MDQIYALKIDTMEYGWVLLKDASPLDKIFILYHHNNSAHDTNLYRRQGWRLYQGRNLPVPNTVHCCHGLSG